MDKELKEALDNMEPGDKITYTQGDINPHIIWATVVFFLGMFVVIGAIEIWGCAG